MRQPKRYSDEFKREAIQLQASSGKTVGEIERELGLSHGLLHHSDQGSQYTSWTYTELRHWQQFTVSMRMNLNSTKRDTSRLH